MGGMGVVGWIVLQAAEKPPVLMQLFPIIMIFFVFYLLVFRPQMKQQKEHEKMMKAIEKGDRVVTEGGVHGLVTGLTDDVITLEIASLKGGERIRVKVDRGRIGRKVESEKGEQS